MTEPTVFAHGTPAETFDAWSQDQTLPYREPSRLKRAATAILPAMLAAIVGAAVAAGVMHYTVPPKTVTVTKTVTDTTQAQSPDERFLMELAQHGITWDGVEPVKQRFLQYGHYVCYQLAPPNPQPFSIIPAGLQNFEAADHQNNPWTPLFTLQNAQDVAKTSIEVYCPQFTGAM